MAGLPVPSVYISDRDETNTKPPVPGQGKIVCQPYSTFDVGVGSRYAIKVTDWIVELLGFG